MILGLAGQAGAGKDFTYQVLRDLLIREKLVAIRVAFADGVREEISDYLETDTDVLWNKPYPIEIRKLLQWWGTELRRAEDPNYWSKKGIAEALRLDASENVHLVVVTDVRFDNEAKAIQEAGGKVYEVVASEDTRRARLGGTLPPAHASEEIDFEVDGYIDSEGPPKLPDKLWGFIGR